MELNISRITKKSKQSRPADSNHKADPDFSGLVSLTHSWLEGLSGLIMNNIGKYKIPRASDIYDLSEVIKNLKCKVPDPDCLLSNVTGDVVT